MLVIAILFSIGLSVMVAGIAFVNSDLVDGGGIPEELLLALTVIVALPAVTSIGLDRTSRIGSTVFYLAGTEVEDARSSGPTDRFPDSRSAVCADFHHPMGIGLAYDRRLGLGSR